MCTKNKQFWAQFKRHTEETLHKLTPWYLHQVQDDFVLCPQSLHPVQTWLKVWLINGGLHYRIQKFEIIKQIRDEYCFLLGFCSVIKKKTSRLKTWNRFHSIFLYAMLHVVVWIWWSVINNYYNCYGYY